MLQGSQSAFPVLILCGGAGTRLREGAGSIPKPLVEIGGKPIVWHVIQIYIAHGFSEFLLLTGFRSELIEDFRGRAMAQLGYRAVSRNGRGDVHGRPYTKLPRSLTLSSRISIVVPPQAPCAGDDDGGATATTVWRRGAERRRQRPRVSGKAAHEHWINGGFFCFERGVLKALETGLGPRARTAWTPCVVW